MGDIEDLQTFLNKVDASVVVGIKGGAYTAKYAHLSQGNMIFHNPNARRKIDEYHLDLHFNAVADFGTYVLALYALIETFNARIPIAGYSYVTGFINISIPRTMGDPQDPIGKVNKKFILNVTRIY